MDNEKIFKEIEEELNKAVEKFPLWPTDPLHAVAILGEEFGELTKDTLELVYEPNKTSLDNLKKEALQTAAMAIRFLKSIDTYEFNRAHQHNQK